MRERRGTAVEVSDRTQHQGRTKRPRWTKSPWRSLTFTATLVVVVFFLALTVGPFALADDELHVTISIDADVSAGRLSWTEPLVFSAPVEIDIEVFDASYVMDPETDPSVRFVVRHEGDRACWGRVLQGGRPRWDGRDGALEFVQVPVQKQEDIWIGSVQVSLCHSVTHLMVCQSPLVRVPFFGIDIPSPHAAPWTPTQRTDELIRVDANPAAGFHWPYFLFVPAGVRDQPYLLVEPNNTGTGDDDPDVHESSARVLASSRYPTTMARELRIPLLVPTFPRPRTDWHIYTHALNRDAMTVQRGNLARVDLQLVQMIQDAQKRLRGSGIDVQEKVLMHGYSASGVFTGRFALMHPEVLKAYACGGFSDSFITLPADDWQRVSLPYPVGISDLRTLIGVGFDLEAFSQVSGYYYRGEEDDNPCLGMPACYDPIHADLIRRLFGRDRHDRWEAIQNVFAGSGVTAEFVTHPGLGHTITAVTISGVVDFFRRIMEDG